MTRAPYAMASGRRVCAIPATSPVLKDSPNPEGALAFIDFFYGNAAGHPEFIRAVGYATSSTAGLAQLPEDEQMRVRHLSGPITSCWSILDFAWIGENRDTLRDR